MQRVCDENVKAESSKAEEGKRRGGEEDNNNITSFVGANAIRPKTRPPINAIHVSCRGNPMWLTLS
jgi:hypothetical protein